MKSGRLIGPSGRWAWLLLPLIGLALAGCVDVPQQGTVINNAGSEGGSPGAKGPANCSPSDPYFDSDGDGLSNCDEINFFGTSPLLADTDGDNLSDFEEIVEFGFKAEHNNFKFNPLIADIPAVDISIVSPPDLELLFAQGTASETTVGTSRSQSSSNTVASSTSVTDSTSLEFSVMGGFEGPVPKGEVTESFSASHEESFSWSTEQTAENGMTWDQAQTTGQSLEFSGASLGVAVNITNRGNLSFTVTNTLLSAVIAAPGGTGILEPLGNLELDSMAGFTPFTIGPGDSAGPFTFINRNLGLGEAQRVLRDSSGLVIGKAAYEVNDINGDSYTHSMTFIAAKAALVTIDYGGKNGLEPEEYRVATNVDPTTLSVTAGDVMRDILRIPYTVNPDGLTVVRGVGTDLAKNALWVVLHLTDRSNLPTDNYHDSRFAPYDFDAISLISGDVLHLVYLEDVDGDTLGAREEAMQGTNPNLADTDSDGISDSDEIKLGWQSGFDGVHVFSSPVIADTDSDGLNDGEEFALTTHPRRTDTDLDGTSDFDEVNAATPTDPTVPDLAGSPFVAISAGDDHSLAVAQNGSLWAWGNNSQGQLGQVCTVGIDCANSNMPLPVGSAVDWADVSAGRQFSLARKVDGTLWAWGRNDMGQLADGCTIGVNCASRSTPLQIAGLIGASGTASVVEFSAGGFHALARLNDGTVPDTGTLWAWGSDAFGQLGQSIFPVGDSSVPLEVLPVETNWRNIAAGGNHSMANRFNAGDVDGAIYHWGLNDKGQLAKGHFNNLAAPALSGGATILSAGDSHSVVINNATTLFGVGSHESGQLGSNYTYSGVCEDGLTESVLLPTWKSVNSGWIDLSAGGAHTLALLDDGAGLGTGKLYSFGSDASGQLGRGVEYMDTGNCSYKTEVFPGVFIFNNLYYPWNNNRIPILVDPNPGWAAVSAGGRHSLALKATGFGNVLYAWGDNSSGQLGLGDFNLRSMPVPVTPP